MTERVNHKRRAVFCAFGALVAAAAAGVLTMNEMAEGPAGVEGTPLDVKNYPKKHTNDLSTDKAWMSKEGLNHLYGEYVDADTGSVIKKDSMGFFAGNADGSPRRVDMRFRYAAEPGHKVSKTVWSRAGGFSDTDAEFVSLQPGVTATAIPGGVRLSGCQAPPGTPCGSRFRTSRSQRTGKRRCC